MNVSPRDGMKFVAVLAVLVTALTLYWSRPDLSGQEAKNSGPLQGAGVFTFESRPPGTPSQAVPARLLSVVDGDTIEIDLNGKRRFVRFIGMDAPEKSANRKARRDSLREGRPIGDIVRDGLAARAWLSTMMKPKDTVWLEFGPEREDHYGRLLCFVYVSGAGMVNLEMVSSGYARPMAIRPNITRRAEIEAAALTARNEGRGLWPTAWGGNSGGD